MERAAARQFMGDGGREVATGTVADYRGRSRGRAESGCPGAEPSCDGEPILKGCGERVLRGKPTLRGHDQAAAGQGQLTQRRVVALAADHEAAAVQEQDGMQPSRAGPVHANGQRARGAYDLDVFDAMQRTRSPLQGEHIIVVLAHSLRGQLADGHVR
jgi:hypothetical protein